MTKNRNRGPASTRRLRRGGYTLVELIVSVGLFALIMTLASGAYLVMIGVSRQTQALSLGIDNLAFALETMTRTIRTSTQYSCGGGDCEGGTSFSVRTTGGDTVSYSRSNSYSPSGEGTVIQNNSESGIAPLTDPSVDVTSLTFYAYGTAPGDDEQPRVVILVAGTVSAGPGKPPVDFMVQTEAVMRGSDI